MSELSYPLHWPAGWPRTETRGASRFGRLAIGFATQSVLAELERLGARKPVISTNLELRLDGLPRANSKPPEDPGAAVYFDLKGHPRVLACDAWTLVGANLRAIAAHIAALRGIERWKVGSVDRAFTGYAALPPAGGSSHAPWWDVLELPRGEADASRIRARAARLIRQHHPDTGDGDVERLFRSIEARDEGLAELERMAAGRAS